MMGMPMRRPPMPGMGYAPAQPPLGGGFGGGGGPKMAYPTQPPPGAGGFGGGPGGGAKVAYPAQPPPGGFGGGGGPKFAPMQPPPGGGFGGLDAMQHPFAPRNRFGPSFGAMGPGAPSDSISFDLPAMGGQFGGGAQGMMPQAGNMMDQMMHPYAPRNRFGGSPLGPGSNMRNLLMQGGMRYL